MTLCPTGSILPCYRCGRTIDAALVTVVCDRRIDSRGSGPGLLVGIQPSDQGFGLLPATRPASATAAWKCRSNGRAASPSSLSPCGAPGTGPPTSISCARVASRSSTSCWPISRRSAGKHFNLTDDYLWTDNGRSTALDSGSCNSGTHRWPLQRNVVVKIGCH